MHNLANRNNQIKSLVFFLLLLILIFIIRKIQNKREQEEGIEEVSAIHGKLLLLMEEYKTNGRIRLTGGNKDILKNPKTKGIFLIFLLIIPLSLASMIVLYIFSSLAGSELGNLLPYLIFGLIGLIVLILLSVLLSRKNDKYIDQLLIGRDLLEIKLLNKSGQTEANPESINYNLKDIRLEYRVEVIRDHDNHARIHMKNHYIYVVNGGKRDKYMILLSDYQENTYKAFIILANLLAENKSLQELSDDNLRQLLKDFNH